MDKNDFLDSFNDIDSDFKLEILLGKRDLRLTDTNIPILRNKAKFVDNETKFKFAIFEKNSSFDLSENSLERTNNTTQFNIFPIAWIQFSEPKIDNIAIQLRKLHYFSCKHVALKLIDCDNRIVNKERFQSPNIDLNYV